MKKIGIVGIAIVGLLLTGCAGSVGSEASSSSTPAPEASSASPTPTATIEADGPSTEGYLLALTEKWGETDDAGRQGLCDGWRELGSEEVRKEMGAPDSFTTAHVERTFADWCQDYPAS